MTDSLSRYLKELQNVADNIMSRSVLSRLFLSIWFIYLLHVGPTNHPGRFGALAVSIVEKGHLHVDAAKSNGLVDAFKFEGHYYINTNPGVSFITVPFWGMGYALYEQLPDASPLRQPIIHNKIVEFIGYAVTSALFSALCALVVALFVYKESSSRKRAIMAAVLFAFGTINFRLSQGLNNNQNVVIASLCVVIYCLVFRPKILHRKISDNRFLIIGILAGLGITVDLSIVPFLMVISVPLFFRIKQTRDGVALFIGGLVPLAALFAYLHSVFGNPILPPQTYTPNVLFTGPDSGFFGLSLPDTGIMLSHLVSPGKGLFIYMPFTIAVFWYVGRKFFASVGENNIKWPGRDFYMIAIFVAYLFWVGATKASEFNIFGPRYLMPAVPFLCILFAVHTRKKHLSILAALVALSFYVNVAGAQLGIGVPNVGFLSALYAVRGPWFPILTWLKQTYAAVGNVPEIITPYGLLVILIIGLAVIWWPYFERKSARSHKLHN